MPCLDLCLTRDQPLHAVLEGILIDELAACHPIKLRAQARQPFFISVLNLRLPREHARDQIIPAQNEPKRRRRPTP